MIKATSWKETVPSENGRTKTVVFNSYVVILCKINDCDVKAVRMDGYRNGTDAMREAHISYPEWNIKGIQKLYDEDFKEKENNKWVI